MYTKKTYFFIISIFVLYPYQGVLLTISLERHFNHNNNLEKRFQQLLHRIYEEYTYDYIVLIKDVINNSSCIFEESVHMINKPIIQLTDLLELQHSSRILLFSCSSQYLKDSNISNTNYQYVPHIIWQQNNPEMDLTQKLSDLCSLIHDHDYFQNLIITPQSWEEEEKYYNCNFQKKIQIFGVKILPSPFLNMQDITVTTESDQLPPRSLLYYDNSGQLKLTGFVGNFITTFAKRYNATLKIQPPPEMGVTVFYEILSNKILMGLLDIAALVTPYKANSTFSYPVELMEYCYMIPLPHIRPAYHVYLDIIDPKVLIVIICYCFINSIFLHIGQYSNCRNLYLNNVLLNDKSLRGLLSQSFVMPRKTNLFMKFIIFLLSYSGILLCTSYQAYLQSHMIHPSLEKRMESYEDIRRNKYKILINERESVFIRGNILQLHQDLFIKVKDFHHFLKLRDSMDTNYIYPVSWTRWTVFQERQKIFQRKLFYYSSHLCLNQFMLLAFPLRPGLPYKFQFNQHILDVMETGLMDHWLEINFLLMVKLKLSSFKDLSIADEYRPALVIKDLLWIWYLYGLCILLVILVFVGEILWGRVKNNNKNI
ncbi:uncharacterized protein ACRADG_010286 [Cochliomyia hominivorax]